jgi:hypothetical protein
VHYINRMNEWPTITETPAGGLFDPAVMERLMAETQRGCWFWLRTVKLPGPLDL